MNKIILLRWNKELFDNVLKPSEGVSVEEHLMCFADISTEAFQLFAASHSELLDTTLTLCEDFDVKSTGIFPTVHDLLWKLEAKREKTKSRVHIDYMDRLINRFKSVCLILGKQLGVETGIPIEVLLNYPVSIELGGIQSQMIKRWWRDLIISRIELYRKYQGHFGELKHMILLDEASQALSKGQTVYIETYIINAMRRFREYGEGFIIADQSISSLNDVTKSLLYAFICLSQSSAKDIRETTEVSNINYQNRDIVNTLEPGVGILKMAGKFPYPLKIVFPYIPPEYITDKEIDDINDNDKFIQHLLSKVKPRQITIEDIVKLKSQNKIENIKTEIKEKTDKPINKTKINLKKLLEAIVAKPFEKSTMIMKNAGFSGSSGNNIKTFAINREYIEEHSINLGTRGAVSKYLELTKIGYKFLDEIAVDYKKPQGKGSFEHRLYQNIISDFYRKEGYKVFIEDSNEQNNSYTLVDVSVESENQRIAFEVEFNINKHIIENITKDLEAGYDKIVIVTKKDMKDKVCEFLENNLVENYKNRVEVKVINDFI